MPDARCTYLRSRPESKGRRSSSNPTGLFLTIANYRHPRTNASSGSPDEGHPGKGPTVASQHRSRSRAEMAALPQGAPPQGGRGAPLATSARLALASRRCKVANARMGTKRRGRPQGAALSASQSLASRPYARADASSDGMSTVNTRRSSFWGIANPAPSPWGSRSTMSTPAPPVVGSANRRSSERP